MWANPHIIIYIIVDNLFTYRFVINLVTQLLTHLIFQNVKTNKNKWKEVKRKKN